MKNILHLPSARLDIVIYATKFEVGRFGLTRVSAELPPFPPLYKFGLFLHYKSF